jgi:hypothetical protein
MKFGDINLEDLEDIEVAVTMLPTPEGYIDVQGDGGVWMWLERKYCSPEFLAEQDALAQEISDTMPPLN